MSELLTCWPGYFVRIQEILDYASPFNGHREQLAKDLKLKRNFPVKTAGDGVEL